MDISGFTSNYIDTYSQMASEKASLGESIKDKNYASATDEELMDACKQFEAYFLEQVFKEMSKTVKLTDDDSDTLVDYFKDQTIQQVAADATEKSSLGLAQTLYEQMRRNYGLAEDVVADPAEQKN